MAGSNRACASAMIGGLALRRAGHDAGVKPDAAVDVATESDGQWRAMLTDLIRAVSGGLLFGVPLLYTMEIWWTGTHTTPIRMLTILALLTMVLLLLMMTAGFRTRRDVQVLDALADTVEALAIGLVVTSAVLFLLRQITFETPARTMLGTIIWESVPFCLGIGVTRFILGDGDSSDESESSDGEDDRDAWTATLGDLGATVIGAAFIVLSIAPTDEIPMLASSMNPEWLLVMMVASLLASYGIVFVAGFTRQDNRQTQPGVLQRPITETLIAYLIGLLVSVALLTLFQRGGDPMSDLLTRTIVLGFPAAVGGAVGRLAI